MKRLLPLIAITITLVRSNSRPSELQNNLGDRQSERERQGGPAGYEPQERRCGDSRRRRAPGDQRFRISEVSGRAARAVIVCELHASHARREKCGCVGRASGGRAHSQQSDSLSGPPAAVFVFRYDFDGRSRATAGARGRHQVSTIPNDQLGSGRNHDLLDRHQGGSGSGPITARC